MDLARRGVAAVLAAAASALAIVGSALPLFSVDVAASVLPLEITMTSWGVEVVGGRSFGGVPANGYPLVAAAIVLAFAAARCRAAARPAAPPRTDRVAGVVTAVGAAFLVCAVWMVALQVGNWVDLYGPPGGQADEFRPHAESSRAAGFWVLLTAALLAVAATVPALASGRGGPRPPAVGVDPDAPTPPYGIAALPAGPAEPAQVHPLTGLPLGEPPPASPPAPSPPAPSPEPQVTPPPPPPRPLPGPAVPPAEDPLAEPPGDRA